MALTLAQLLGTPGWATDLDRNIEIGKKASGGSSAIAAGRVVFLTDSTGVWAIGTSTSSGRTGVIPNLDPVNVDGDTELQIATGVDSEWYVESNGTLKPGCRVACDTGGKVKAFVLADVTTTVSEANVENAIKDFERVVGNYKGKYGEGSGLGNPPTDATSADPVRIALRGN